MSINRNTSMNRVYCISSGKKNEKVMKDNKNNNKDNSNRKEICEVVVKRDSSIKTNQNQINSFKPKKNIIVNLMVVKKVNEKIKEESKEKEKIKRNNIETSNKMNKKDKDIIDVNLYKINKTIDENKDNKNLDYEKQCLEFSAQKRKTSNLLNYTQFLTVQENVSKDKEQASKNKPVDQTIINNIGIIKNINNIHNVIEEKKPTDIVNIVIKPLKSETKDKISNEAHEEKDDEESNNDSNNPDLYYINPQEKEKEKETEKSYKTKNSERESVFNKMTSFLKDSTKQVTNITNNTINTNTKTTNITYKISQNSQNYNVNKITENSESTYTEATSKPFNTTINTYNQITKENTRYTENNLIDTVESPHLHYEKQEKSETNENIPNKETSKEMKMKETKENIHNKETKVIKEQTNLASNSKDNTETKNLSNNANASTPIIYNKKMVSKKSLQIIANNNSSGYVSKDLSVNISEPNLKVKNSSSINNMNNNMNNMNNNINNESKMFHSSYFNSIDTYQAVDNSIETNHNKSKFFDQATLDYTPDNQDNPENNQRPLDNNDNNYNNLDAYPDPYPDQEIKAFSEVIPTSYKNSFKSTHTKSNNDESTKYLNNRSIELSNLEADLERVKLTLLDLEHLDKKSSPKKQITFQRPNINIKLLDLLSIENNNFEIANNNFNSKKITNLYTVESTNDINYVNDNQESTKVNTKVNTNQTNPNTSTKSQKSKFSSSKHNFNIIKEKELQFRRKRCSSSKIIGEINYSIVNNKSSVKLKRFMLDTLDNIVEEDYGLKTMNNVKSISKFNKYKKSQSIAIKRNFTCPDKSLMLKQSQVNKDNKENKENFENKDNKESKDSLSIKRTSVKINKKFGNISNTSNKTLSKSITKNSKESLMKILENAKQSKSKYLIETPKKMNFDHIVSKIGSKVKKNDINITN